MPNASVRANARTLPKTAKSLAEQISAKAWILDELTAAETKLREARTKAEAQPQAGPAAAPNQNDVTRYLNLEGPIRSMKYMSGIAHDLAYDLLGLETPETEEIILRLSDRERNQLFFAIDRVREMAKELDGLYHRQHGERS